MKIREVMSQPVIRIGAEETVAVAARTLTHYNIGALPVCGSNGRLQGLITDRDLVTRCIAAGRDPQKTKVSQIMGSRQIRRLPVLENEKLCGMVSLGDLTRTEADTGPTLSRISSNIRHG